MPEVNVPAIVAGIKAVAETGEPAQTSGPAPVPARLNRRGTQVWPTSVAHQAACERTRGALGWSRG